MSILPKLFSIYRRAGYEPMTGFNPHHFKDYVNAPYTKFIKDNTIVGVGGLALQEIMFLEGFAGLIDPQNILVIGNAHGWSTIALALIFPNAKVVGIDPDPTGNELTNRLARENGLDAISVKGMSPGDVASICGAHLGGKVDLVLIDAMHNDEAVYADFSACKAVADGKAVYLFHDVIDWNMTGSFRRILSENSMEGQILLRTPSGMAVAWKEAPEAFKEYVSVFSCDRALFHGYRRALIGLNLQTEWALSSL